MADVTAAMAPTPARRYPAAVLSVHDGDTLAAVIEVGLGVRLEAHCRLVGIDTPELRGPEPERALRARDRLRDLCAGGVELEADGRREKFGRLLVRVFTAGATESVNDLLVREGLARPYDGGKRMAYAERGDSSAETDETRET
jgi:micrococcal nuclease